MDTKLFKHIQRLKKDDFVIITDGKVAREIVKKPNIKKLRQNGKILVAYDRAKQTTLIFKIPKI